MKRKYEGVDKCNMLLERKKRSKNLAENQENKGKRYCKTEKKGKMKRRYENVDKCDML